MQPNSINELGTTTPKSLGPTTSESTAQGSSLSQQRGRIPQQAQTLPPEAPTEFQKFVAATTGQMLQIYGEDLFRNVPSTFSPIDSATVPSEYVIGPDDELRIHIWGQVNYSGNLRVDRSGDIYLPEIGIVHVAGLQFSALDQYLHTAVSKTYRNFSLSVDMGQIRAIQIYVTGQARRPGVYTVSSLSSLVDALFSSGGPSAQGSLRHILLNRNGKTIADFDLYGLLIHGDKSHDVRLQPEDVLFIDAVGPQVAIAGSIHNPGIYELRGSETIRDVIEDAGKTSAVASSARISVERVEDRQHRQAMEFGFDDRGLSAPLADGDILRIYSIVPAYQKTVTLRGNVANPGRFSWRKGMRLSDLIPDRDSLVSRDYWWKRSHLGLPVPEFESAVATPEGTLAPALTPVVQQTTNPSGTERTGSIALQAPNSAQQTKLFDVHQSAPAIDWNYAVIERVDTETLKTSLIPFDLGKLLINHDAAQDIALQPGDTVTIFSQGDIRVPLQQQTKYVNLEGEFLHSGVYSVQPGETLRDLVRRAGGLADSAYLYGAEFTRESTRLLQQQRIDEYARIATMEAEKGAQALSMSASSPSGIEAVNASRAAAQQQMARLSQIRATGRIVLKFHPDSGKIEDVPPMELENGDRFIVPSVPSTVNVVGAVYDQNSFLFEAGKPVLYYVKLAGGPTRDADWHHSFVVRADGSVVSRVASKGMGAWPNSFDQLRLNPGDTVIVPDKAMRPSALRGVLDWTQVFSQLALGAAAINVL